MASLASVVAYANAFLDVSAFDDHAPNGLQLEGRPEVRRILSAVTASLLAIEAAVDYGADALLVHHGYFWRGEDPCIVGMKKARFRMLLEHDISLLAYHLPLDAHETVGNNACLAVRLELKPEGRFGPGKAARIGFFGRAFPPVSPQELISRVESSLDRKPLHIAAGPEVIARVGWCTGAAQGFVEEAAKLGLDAFLSGEISEQTTHVARESGLHYFALGHHASERYGVHALGEHLAARFKIEHRFADLYNPA
jgi:dinuclear metal center YbgI/SA1388 family protein